MCHFKLEKTRTTLPQLRDLDYGQMMEIGLSLAPAARVEKNVILLRRCFCSRQFISTTGGLVHNLPLFFVWLFHHISPIGPINELQRLPISRVVQRDLPISPQLTPTSFYRDAGTALLHLVNQWLNFLYSGPHPFRYGNQKKNKLLLKLELTNSNLVGV